MKPLLLLASDLVHCAILKWGHYSDQYATWLVQKLAALLDAESTLGEWAQRLDCCRYEDRRELFGKIFDDLHVRIASGVDDLITPQVARLIVVYRARYVVDPAHIAMVAKFGRLKCGVVAYSFCEAKARTTCECVACR